jgi:hypothetical protein
VNTLTANSELVQARIQVDFAHNEHRRQAGRNAAEQLFDHGHKLGQVACADYDFVRAGFKCVRGSLRILIWDYKHDRTRADLIDLPADRITVEPRKVGVHNRNVRSQRARDLDALVSVNRREHHMTPPENAIRNIFEQSPIVDGNKYSHLV